MDKLLGDITAIVGARGVLTGADAHGRNSGGVGHNPVMARAIIRPASTQELSQVMKLCHAAGQSVVPAGGLTGLTHAAQTTSDDLMISMERMRTIEDIDISGQTMTVQAGVALEAAQKAAADKDMMFAVDLGARGSATIGGTISTNAGGSEVIRFGMMRANILGLEAVMADGTVISSLNRLLKNNTGYDIKQLFIGAEGTLGLITRAVLRLHPMPKSRNTAILAFDDFPSLTAYFAKVSQSFGNQLTSFEVMWESFYDVIAVRSGRHTPPIPGGHAYYCITETRGNHPESDADLFEQTLGSIMEDGTIQDAVIASSDAQRDAIWAIRDDIDALGENLSTSEMFDVSLPIRDMQAYTEGLRRAVDAQWGKSAELIIFGHMGDGNLHIIIAPKDWSHETHKKAEEMVYLPLSALGGSVSAEHGIGLEKKPWLHLSRSPEEIALMRTLKQALDPKNILNPGKIFD